MCSSRMRNKCKHNLADKILANSSTSISNNKVTELSFDFETVPSIERAVKCNQ